RRPLRCPRGQGAKIHHWFTGGELHCWKSRLGRKETVMCGYLDRGRRLVLALVLVVGSAASAHADLISVALQSSSVTSSAGPQTFTGVDAEAAGISSLFAAANVWNHLQVPSSPTVNPTFANLVDSTGAATTVGFAISGTVRGYNIFNFRPAADALRG